MTKKQFSISLDLELVKELEKRAKKDYLTIEELINNILWRSAKTSLRKNEYPKAVGAEKFVEIFSRSQGEKGQKYFCNECQKDHKYSSKIGKKHIRYANK